LIAVRMCDFVPASLFVLIHPLHSSVCRAH
jgi:hypothetical protein